MSSIQQISKDRDAAFLVIDGLLSEARKRLKAGKASMQDEITALHKLRNQIENAALAAILASPELAAALKVLAQVATDLGDTADNLKIAAEVTAKFAEVLGKAKTVVSEAQKVLG